MRKLPDQLPDPVCLIDSEFALVGSVIFDPARLVDIEALERRDFAEPKLGTLLQVLRDMHAAGEPIGNPQVLARRLPQQGIDLEFTSAAGLHKLLTAGGSGKDAGYHAQLITNAARLRELHNLSLELLERSANPAAKATDVSEFAHSELTKHTVPVDEVTTLAEAAGRVILDAVATLENGREPSLFTGIGALDETVGGWRPGELVVLAARPGLGKTSFALQVAQHVAGRGKPAIFISLEMSANELAARSLCAAANVNSQTLRTGRVTREEVQRLSAAQAAMTTQPLLLWAPPAATAARIAAVARMAHRAKGLALLVVDYAGLVRPADSRIPRHEQVAGITAAFKSIAKELEVPVLLLAQLNRAADAEAPRLAHLRESGSLEQDADLVLFLHAADVREPHRELIVAKHRHGAVGRLTLAWHGERTEFAALPSEGLPRVWSTA